MQYASVGLPKILVERYHKIKRYYGYRSFSELVVSATRAKIQELENEIEEKSTQQDYAEQALALAKEMREKEQ